MSYMHSPAATGRRATHNFTIDAGLTRSDQSVNYPGRGVLVHFPRPEQQHGSGCFRQYVRDRRGQKVDLRVTAIPAPPRVLKPREIRYIRESLRASQTVFAHFLCVSPKAVQSWEQGSRRPQSTALRLLMIAKKNPKALLQG